MQLHELKWEPHPMWVGRGPVQVALVGGSVLYWYLNDDRYVAFSVNDADNLGSSVELDGPLAAQCWLHEILSK